MDLITAWTIAAGIWAADLPALELRALANQVALPTGAAEKWDAIGTFAIKGTTVKLYFADTDSIAEKAAQEW